MSYIQENFPLTFVSILLTFLVGFVTFFKWRFTYWKRRGVPQLSPTIPFGDMASVFFFKQTVADVYEASYKTLKSRNAKYGGIYFSMNPILIITDRELMKSIMIKDFVHFMDHGLFPVRENEPILHNLFNLEGDNWRTMRQKLTPTFTSGKIKMMFETINNCALGLKEIVNKSVENGTTLDLKDATSRYSIDVIGSIAFGVECNSLKDPDCEFNRIGKILVHSTKWDKLKELVVFASPKFLFKLKTLKLIKDDITKFFLRTVKDVVHLRETRNIVRKDFMQLLIQLRNEGNLDGSSSDLKNKNKHMSLIEMAAQVFVFFTAGFDTTSSALHNALFELAYNQDIQNKLRIEIRTVLEKYGGTITYEAIQEMVYMDRVIYETLRKYPGLLFLNRECTKDYNIPDTSIWIKKGTPVILPVKSIQWDPEYYPDPEKFDPDRFADGDNSKLPWFPFGDGPRICIGMRFALVEVKIALVTLIADYKLKLNPKTDVPLNYSTTFFIKTLKSPVLIDVEKA